MENKKNIRTIQQWDEKIAIPNDAGGEDYAEDSIGLSIEQMYQRMIAMGELQRGMRTNANYSGDKKGAEAIMKSAREAPIYMRDGDIYNISKKMADITEIEKININTKKTKEKLDKAVIEAIKARDEGVKIE